MRNRTLIAAAVAGALSLPFAANANEPGSGIRSSPDSVTWYYPDGSVVHLPGSGPVAAADHEVSFDPVVASLDGGIDEDAGDAMDRAITWYYPDGTVIHQESVALFDEETESLSASAGSSSDSQPSQVTWFYPDGSVMQQDRTASIDSASGDT